MADEVPGALDRAVIEILDALGLSVPEDAPLAAVAVEARPVADLVLELTSPGLEKTADGKQRGKAKARLVNQPADVRERGTRSSEFDLIAPIGPIEAEDLAWYLERYSDWPSDHYVARARKIEANLPRWGRLLYDARRRRHGRFEARAQAIKAFLAYRRAGGENHNPGAQLIAMVHQAVVSGESAEVAKQLAELGSRPEVLERFQVLVAVLLRILEGERDLALAEDARLYYMDAVEVGLLLEGLNGVVATDPAGINPRATNDAG